MVLHLEFSFSAPTVSSMDRRADSVSIHEMGRHRVIPAYSAPYAASLPPSRIQSHVDGHHQEKQHSDDKTLRNHIESLAKALDSEDSIMIPVMSRTTSPMASSSSRINHSEYHPRFHPRKNNNHRMMSSSHRQARVIDTAPEATDFVSFIHALPSSHSWDFHTDSDAVMIPAATISKPNILSMKQLNPPKMEMPMMMPLPFTSALHKGMKQGMETMQSFMSQMQMMMPQLPTSLSQMMPSLPMMHSQPSPCGGMGGSMMSMPMSMPQMSMPQMGMSPKPDLMGMMQKMAEQLSPMNFINNMMNMMKSTQMAMGMGQQMAAAQQMSHSPCMAGGD